VEDEGQRTTPSESEVNMMYRSYADTGGNVNEEIKLLNSISHVSARLARNLRVLAASQSEEGGKETCQRWQKWHRPSKSSAPLLLLLMPQPTGSTSIFPAKTILSSKNQNAPAKKEEPKPEIKLEDVRAVLAEKSRAGHTAEVRTLLQKYGAAKLSAVSTRQIMKPC
jgi:hypothetical protein